MSLLPLFALAALIQDSGAQEFQVTVSTVEGTTFTGKAQLPPKIAVKTKYGDLEVETRTCRSIRRQDKSWIIETAEVTTRIEFSFGPVVLVTGEGKLTFKLDDIASLTIQAPAVLPAASPGGAPPREARFWGYPFRQRFVHHSDSNIPVVDTALLLPGGRHLALLDPGASSCVFMELDSGKTVRARVEAGARHLIVRNGKVYVANTEARSITVIDAASFKSLKQIPCAEAPVWFAAPAYGSLLYVATKDHRTAVQTLNVQTDELGESLSGAYKDISYLHHARFIAVTPDNRHVIALSRNSVNPSVLDLEFPGVGVPRHIEEDHAPSFVSDFAADRIYFGRNVYSADMKTRIAPLAVDLLTPHPTRRLLFGRKAVPQPQRSYTPAAKSTVVELFDEDNFARLGEIEIGDRVLGLAVTEDKLYVVGETQVYPVELKSHVPAEALARAKPVRNTTDLAKLAAAGTTTKKTTYTLPYLGGWALLADSKTLVLGLREKAELLYVDTTDGTEIRRVSLDFQPGDLAAQGDTLFAVRVNSSALHALDAASGKVKKELKFPGDPLVRVACATKGRVYASNAKGHILSIDPAGGSAVATAARGLFLEVDPKGGFLYAGRTSPNDWGVEVEKDAAGTTTWYYDNWGYRSMVRKYAVSGTTLRQVAVNDNTAVNGQSMVLSPDGTMIAMAGGGGWRSKRTGGGVGGYTIAIYDTKDLTTMLGQVDLGAYPENIAFHPVLDIGATLKSDGEVTIFRAKSMATVKRWKVLGASSGFNEPGWLMFGGRGEKLLYWQMAGDLKQPGKLFLLALELNDQDRAALRKAYGARAPATDPARFFRDAEEAERKGEMENALRYYKRIVAEHPDSPEAAEARKRISEIDKK